MSASEKNGETTEITVPTPFDKLRLDQFLTNQSQLELTRSSIQKLITDENILVNGEIIAKNYKVRPGDKISITVPPLPPLELIGENIPLEILFEDEHLAVVNKPAGMVTHPGVGNRSGTLVNALIHHFGELPESGDAERPGIVHRLDKETSGLLVVAKQKKPLLLLQDALRKREIKRTYLAIVCGHMSEATGIIDLPIGRSQSDRRVMRVTKAGGRESQTEYKLLERFRSYDLLEVHLQTGRTHQIRVHFSYLGHPVFGDRDYGGREKYLQGMFGPERPLAAKLLALISRQALHSSRIAFDHPFSGAPLEFESDLPDDYSRVLRLLRADGA